MLSKLSFPGNLGETSFSKWALISGRRPRPGLSACAKEMNSRWMEGSEVTPYSKGRKKAEKN
jgi:hypothetical protein